jgi:hypothetical protein
MSMDEFDEEQLSEDAQRILEDDETEELLDSLYRPECYEEGEMLCLELLEEVDPDWQPAKMYLLLFLAAQDYEDDALEMIDELESDYLFDALKQLAFGAGTDTEAMVYEDIIACAQERGLQSDLDKFFGTEQKALARPDINSSLATWD